MSAAALTSVGWQLQGMGIKLVELLRTTLWSPTLLASDLRYALLAVSASPYHPRAFEQHLRRRQLGGDEEAFTYGETPWFTAARMLRRVGLAKGQRFVDLGSGEGRVVLLAALRFGARSVGYEIIADRHLAARRVLRQTLGLPIELRHADAAQADLGDFDVAYSAWTCLDAPARRRLLAALRTLPAGAHAITVTHPIEDEGFTHLGAERLWLSWGRGEVHYHRRR